MTKYTCYFITPENKAEVCFFVEASSALEAAEQAKARFEGAGYAALEIWDGGVCALNLREQPSTLSENRGPIPQSAAILVVDDESMVRSITANLLREEGFTVTEAESGEDALNKCAAGLRFSILLTDIRMPDMTGFELANRVADHYPSTKVIYVTGYPVKESGPLNVMRPGSELLHKPVPIARLAASVRRALGR
ncbi:MAG: response regulator [Rhodospirillaceae bacterium]